jgi:hypothetical protein
MLRKNGNLGEFSSSEGILAVCADGQFVNLAWENAWIDMDTMKNKTLQPPFKACKEHFISNNGKEMKEEDDSNSKSCNLFDLILYGPSENDNYRPVNKGHPIIFVKTESIYDSCLPDNETTKRGFETSQPLHRIQRLSSLFSKSCDLKTTLSISTKDLINHCRIRKKLCSFFASKLLNNTRKHHSKH